LISVKPGTMVVIALIDEFSYFAEMNFSSQRTFKSEIQDKKIQHFLI